MSDNKPVQKIPTYVFYAVGLFLLWIVWYLNDNSFITPHSFLSKSSVEALKWGLIFIFSSAISIMVLWLRSPVVTFPGGKTSYDPGRDFIKIVPPLDKDPESSTFGEPILAFNIVLIPIGGFKAGRVYKKGGGKSGWIAAADYLLKETWPHTAVRASVVNFYNSSKEKRKLPRFIHDQAKEKCGATLGFDEEATFMLMLSPDDTVEELPPEIIKSLQHIDLAREANQQAKLYEDKYEEVHDQLLESTGVFITQQAQQSPQNQHSQQNEGQA